MSRLRLSPAASLTPTPEGVILRSDLGTFRLRGADLAVFASSIVPLLDGNKDLSEICAALEDFDADSVAAFIGLLEQRGLVERVREQEADAREPQRRFVRAMGLDPAAIDAQLAEAHVIVVGLEPWAASAVLDLARSGVGRLTLLDEREFELDDLFSATPLLAGALGQTRAEALRHAIGVLAPDCEVELGGLEDTQLLDEAKDPSLILTALTVDDHQLLQRVSELAWARGLVTLHAHLDGFCAWIGPLVEPNTSACWNCFRLRKLARAADAKAAHELDAKLLAARPQARARVMLAPMAPMTGHLLALEALEVLVFASARLRGCVRVHDLVTGEASQHRLIPMPWCELCGGAAAQLDDPLRPPDPPHRALDAVRSGEQLREVLDGFVDDKLGLVHSLTLGDEIDGWTLPYTASATLTNYTEGRHIHWMPLGQAGAGKSLSGVSAQIGAVGEAIERYSAARYRHRDLRRAPLAQLDGEILDPRTLCLFDDAQYDSPGFFYQRYDPEQPIDWLRGTWFGTEQPVWIPALVAYFNYAPSAGEQFCQVSSNGLAAGGDRRDAALRAVFELLERDAFMLTWLARVPARPIMLDDSLEPAMREVIRLLAARGLELELFLLDVGVGVPTVMALGHGDGRQAPGTIVSLACHVSAHTAARKAILEQAHVGPYLAHLMARSRVPETPEQVRQLDDHAAYYFPPQRRGAFDFLRGLSPLPYAQLHGLGPGPEHDLHAYTAGCLARAGLRVAIADVTAPDVALSPFRVARAVGPYLHPINFGYHLRRTDNPRLRALLNGRPVNPDPHPLA